MAFDWLTAGASLLGGVLGGQEQTKEGPQLDARLAQYVYGKDGNSGLISDAANVYKNQMATGGLNGNQQAGLNYLQQFYTSPMLNNGYNSMAKMSTGLMDKYAAKFGNDNFQAFKPNIQTQPIANTDPFQFAQQSTPSGSPVTPSGVPGGSGGGNKSPSGPGTTIGTGNMTNAINDSAEAAFKKYLALGLTPAVAAALVQKMMATNETLDAVNATDDPIATLNAVQGWTDQPKTEAAPLGYQLGWDSSPSASPTQMSGGLLRQTNGNLNSMGGAQGLTGNINGPGYGFQGNGGLGLKGGW
jgi:hypothetical protein